jgi:flavorubredoxin
LKKLLILYLSNTGNTKEIADIISSGNFDNDIYTEIVHFDDTIQPLINSYEYIAIGLPEKEKIANTLIEKINFENKKIALFGSYDDNSKNNNWLKQISELLKEKNKTYIFEDNILKIHKSPKNYEKKICLNFGKKFMTLKGSVNNGL